MADRALARLSAALLFAGVVVSLVAGVLHPAREMPNNHAAVFAEYAAHADWTMVHLGQFVGMALLIAGLLALYSVVDARIRATAWLGRFGAVAAAVALALYGVLQAVDGVALKQAVDAWARAPEAEKAARFASAETIRWLEWAVRSYQSFTLGLALFLIGAAIGSTARVPRPIGYLMALSGLGYVAQGFILGAEGFSPTNSLPQLGSYVLIVLWSLWLGAAALRMRGVADVPAEPTAIPRREAA
jgi:hypothetical protein